MRNEPLPMDLVAFLGPLLLCPYLRHVHRYRLRVLAYDLDAQAEYVFGPLFASTLLTCIEPQLRLGEVRGFFEAFETFAASHITQYGDRAAVELDALSGSVLQERLRDSVTKRLDLAALERSKEIQQLELSELREAMAEVRSRFEEEEDLKCIL
jgi:hypothetical protein